MILYNYDKSTGEYLSSSQAVIDPLETIKQGKTVYMFPAYSTLIVPPVKKEGYALCFDTNKNAWTYVEDHRGQQVWDKQTLEPIEVTELGPVNNYLTTFPEPKNEYQYWDNGAYRYPSLDVLKLQVKMDLDEKYEEKQSQLYKVGKYYIQPSWANTYTTTLVAMQEDMEDNGNLDQTYKVLLITNLSGSLTQIQVTNIDEFMPFYNAVKMHFKRLTEEYHEKTVLIANSNSADNIVDIILKY